MKKLIAPPTIEFEISVTLSNSGALVASEIKQVQKADNCIDEQALAEYDDFVGNVFNLLDPEHFHLVEQHRSNKSRTSHYFIFYLKADNQEIVAKFIFIFRLSDHRTHTPPQDRWGYNLSVAHKHKLPSQPKRPRPVEVTVIVNSQQFDSYQDALEFIKQRLDSVRAEHIESDR